MINVLVLYTLQSTCNYISELKIDNFLVQELEDFLIVADNLIVSIPEIDLLRKYRSDACSWACHLQDVLQNLNERNDYGNIVIELSHILKAGELLRVQGMDFQNCSLFYIVGGKNVWVHFPPCFIQSYLNFSLWTS